MTAHTPRHTTDQDWRDKKFTSDEHQTIYSALLVLAALLIGIVLGAKLFSGDNPIFQDDYGLNVFTEVLSFIGTVWLVDRVAEFRRIQRLKDRLVHEAGSQSNERAKAAIDDLRHYGWLAGDNGLLKAGDLKKAHLKGVNLTEANLTGAYLGGVNLTGANLVDAKLQGAKLNSANLTQANLRSANLVEANLEFSNLTKADMEWANLTNAYIWKADLTGADLRWANLSETILREALLIGTILWGANLTATNLREANLSNAKLENAKFDEDTTMPNSEKWHADMDLRMFTDPSHPDFYEPPGF